MLGCGPCLEFKNQRKLRKMMMMMMMMMMITENCFLLEMKIRNILNADGKMR
jgi:hypothetical protein